VVGCKKADAPAPAPGPAAPIAAPVTDTMSVGEASTVSFLSTKNGDTEVPGNIPGLSGEFTVDMDKLDSVSGTITADLSSVNTGDEGRDQNLRTAFFEVAK
jgi:polyisoprenoid-binding protein YceI